MLTDASSFVFLNTRGGFRNFELYNEVQGENAPLVNIFFAGSLTGNQPEISSCPVLAIPSRRWVCLLKDKIGRIYYKKKRTQLLRTVFFD